MEWHTRGCGDLDDEEEWNEMEDGAYLEDQSLRCLRVKSSRLESTRECRNRVSGEKDSPTWLKDYMLYKSTGSFHFQRPGASSAHVTRILMGSALCLRDKMLVNSGEQLSEWSTGIEANL